MCRGGEAVLVKQGLDPNLQVPCPSLSCTALLPTHHQ